MGGVEQSLRLLLDQVAQQAPNQGVAADETGDISPAQTEARSIEENSRKHLAITMSYRKITMAALIAGTMGRLLYSVAEKFQITARNF